jgi:hypothetical protein
VVGLVVNRERVQELAQDGYIMVTWANHHYLEFVISWVKHVKAAGKRHHENDMHRMAKPCGVGSRLAYADCFAAFFRDGSQCQRMARIPSSLG